MISGSFTRDSLFYFGKLGEFDDGSIYAFCVAILSQHEYYTMLPCYDMVRALIHVCLFCPLQVWQLRGFGVPRKDRFANHCLNRFDFCWIVMFLQFVYSRYFSLSCWSNFADPSYLCLHILVFMQRQNQQLQGLMGLLPRRRWMHTVLDTNTVHLNLCPDEAHSSYFGENWWSIGSEL